MTTGANLARQGLHGHARRALKARSFLLSLAARMVCAVLLAWLVLPAQARLLELRQAHAVVTVQDLTTWDSVELPYHWDRLHPGLPGMAVFDVPFELESVPDVPFGLYLPRLGNAYEIWLNGVLLQRNGDMLRPNGADFAKGPRNVTILPGLLRSSNLLRVHIRADVGRRGGLAPLTLGPLEEVYPLYLSDYRWRSTGSFVVLLLSLFFGFVALALWATQEDTTAAGGTGRDPLYLFAAAAELSWALRVMDAIIEVPPLPWAWWGSAQVVVSAIWACSIGLFCIEVALWSQRSAVRWLRYWLGFILLSSVAAGVSALVYGHALALTLWYAALGLTFVIFVPLFLATAVRGAAFSHKLVAAAMLLNTLVGLRDLYVFRLSSEYGVNTFLRYSAVLFGLALGYIVVARFHAASVRARDLSASLASRVAQREQELAQSYQRLEQLAREQERTLERARMLRDMHDGVGSHISTAIRQLQSGRASRDDVLLTLRDSLDQLKLSIDAINLPAGDVSALLANIRYRLAPRFAASDIGLIWEVDLLEPVARLDGAQMRQLQFMLFEALSNVLQHAKASTLIIRAQALAPPERGVALEIIDNGVGFDVGQVTSKGLRAMAERARGIGAELKFDSTPAGTRIQVKLE